MRYFQGYLRTFAHEGEQLSLRLFAGAIDPEPEDHPVLLVVVREPLSVDVAIQNLKHLEQEFTWLYLSQPDNATLNIESENGATCQLRGLSIEIEVQPYGASEWEWLARSNHEHAVQLNESLVSTRERLNRAIELIVEQQARVAVKAQGHEVGSTARTLYQQHAEFLARLRAATEAYPSLESGLSTAGRWGRERPLVYAAAHGPSVLPRPSAQLER